MPLSLITFNTDAYQAKDTSSGFGQVRSGLHELVQSVHDGHLEKARLAYKNLSLTAPAVFDRVSLKLTGDYDAIGRALGESNITEAQKAVLQLGQDLHDIGRAESASSRYSNTPGHRIFSSSLQNMIRAYRPEGVQGFPVGIHIDIMA
ncbi:hypothetical protein ACJ77P_01110 [Syntrophus buswellii]|mgnify:FL=1|uniref:hypothetical protein n=1 Tax=Syntrophus buswellii TaxID=43774 RepID=UPI0038D4D8EE